MEFSQWSPSRAIEPLQRVPVACLAADLEPRSLCPRGGLLLPPHRRTGNRQRCTCCAVRSSIDRSVTLALGALAGGIPTARTRLVPRSCRIWRVSPATRLAVTLTPMSHVLVFQVDTVVLGDPLGAATDFLLGCRISCACTWCAAASTALFISGNIWVPGKQQELPGDKRSSDSRGSRLAIGSRRITEEDSQVFMAGKKEEEGAPALALMY